MLRFFTSCAKYMSAEGRSLGFLTRNLAVPMNLVSVRADRTVLVRYEPRPAVRVWVHNSKLRLAQLNMLAYLDYTFKFGSRRPSLFEFDISAPEFNTLIFLYDTDSTGSSPTQNESDAVTQPALSMTKPCVDSEYDVKFEPTFEYRVMSTNRCCCVKFGIFLRDTG